MKFDKFMTNQNEQIKQSEPYDIYGDEEDLDKMLQLDEDARLIAEYEEEFPEEVNSRFQKENTSVNSRENVPTAVAQSKQEKESKSYDACLAATSKESKNLTLYERLKQINQENDALTTKVENELLEAAAKINAREKLVQVSKGKKAYLKGYLESSGFKIQDKDNGLLISWSN